MPVPCASLPAFCLNAVNLACAEKGRGVVAVFRPSAAVRLLLWPVVWLENNT